MTSARGSQVDTALRGRTGVESAGQGSSRVPMRLGRSAGLRKVVSARVLLPVAVAVVFLSAWEILGRLSDPILFAPPSQVYLAFVDLVKSGQMQSALAVTLNTLLVGFTVSAVIGIALGVLLGRRETLRRLVEPYLDAIYATPRVVIVPLVIVWFGIGYSGRLFIVFIGTVIPIIVNTAIGVRYARPDLVEVAASLGIKERQLIRHVIIPGAIPFIIAGLRIGAGRALLGVVIAEIFLDLTGVGGIIASEAGFFHTASMLAAVLVFAVLGIVLMTSLTWLENKFSTWKGQGTV
jgi:ABC-type nitrate/sulfonate/bicarbonate transport system permease component